MLEEPQQPVVIELAESVRAFWRTRSSALGTPSPALGPGRVLPAAFPLAGLLSSTTSAAESSALFGGFAGTTRPSDFPRSCIRGLPPRRSPCGPRPDRHATPGTTKGGASTTGTGNHGTSPFSRMEFPRMPGFFDRAGSGRRSR
jgi:hypothetical protein